MQIIARNLHAHQHFSPLILSFIHSLSFGGYVFQKCRTMDQLKQIHCLSIKNGLNLHTPMYSKMIAFCFSHGLGDNINYARNLFVKMLDPNVFVWNVMIKGYSRINCPENAASLYVAMLRNNNVKPDSYTFPFLLKGFNRDIPLEFGKGIHAHICKFGFGFNGYVQHSLIHMYCLYGQVDTARRVFDNTAKNDVAIWNLMISGHNKRKQFEESLQLFTAMEKNKIPPNSITLVSVLSACSELKDLDTGKKIHQYINNHGKVKSDLKVNNALANMYSSCNEMEAALNVFRNMQDKDVISWTTIIKGFISSGQIDQARRYFVQMPKKDSVSWTVLLDGYLKLNRFKDVLLLFREMQAAKIKPDAFTSVSIITACAHLGALELGEWVRFYIEKYNMEDIYVDNALIDMYFKCGEVDRAVKRFLKMSSRDKFTWTSMIVGLAINGHGREALAMFSNMLIALQRPDEVTYIGVLSACTHAGMVNEGKSYFTNMTIQHEIEPNLMHYGCLVDLLGRAGKLREAYEVIKNMPMKPNAIVWGTLLSACRLHMDVEMADIAAEQLLELEPENEGVYVLLCNIYATCKKWERLQALRKIAMERGIKKTPGCSLIEVNGVVHEFVAGDCTHPQSKQIFLQLEELNEDLKLAGNLPNISELILDIDEEEQGKVNWHTQRTGYYLRQGTDCKR